MFDWAKRTDRWPTDIFGEENLAIADRICALGWSVEAWAVREREPDNYRTVAYGVRITRCNQSLTFHEPTLRQVLLRALREVRGIERVGRVTP